MKTLTVKQPFAYLIFNGKDIENRTWPTKHRGRVLIHASAKRCNFNEIFTDEQWIETGENNRVECILFTSPVSAIIGSVEIVDCVVNHPSVWAEKRDGRLNSAKQWIEKPIYNWVLANPILFPEPIPAKGKLSLWDYPNILAEPEEKDGELFCHCQLSVDEKYQVTGSAHFGHHCRYCGGRWYK